MELKELIKLSVEKQTIHLIVDEWRITASGDALKCCANDEVLSSTITSIAAEDAAIVVRASCAEKKYNGCEGCRHFDLEENDEPCASCKGTAKTREENWARRNYFERCKEEKSNG